MKDAASKAIAWRAKAEGIAKDAEWKDKYGYSYVRRLGLSVIYCFPTRTLKAETIEAIVKEMRHLYGEGNEN